MRRTIQAATASLFLAVGLLATTVIAQGMYTQSPYLDARVASGELPPLEERLPATPNVVQPIDEVGVYGGQFNVFSLGNHPWNDLTEEPARGPFLLELTIDGEFIPDLALDFEQSEDHTTFTLHLREGLRWSNGDPFTSEDFRFKREDMREFDVAWTQSQFGTPDGFVETPDDYTVIMHLGAPIPKTLLNMVHWKGGEWSLFHPSNYLKTWHIDHNEDAEALATEEGFDSWQDAFNWHREFNPLNDVNKPTTQYWMPVEFSTTARLYERNPYLHQVDTAGQQLPYVDTVLSQVVDPETYNLKIVAGEADLAFGSANFENFTLYKENEGAGNYTVYTMPSFQTGVAVYHPNLSHPDPELNRLLNSVDFRAALSTAINREEINDIVFAGFGVGLQHTVVRSASFYQEQWGTNFADYNPDLANELLDGLGLTERDSNGIRLRSDGDPLTVIIEMSANVDPSRLSLHELVKEYWEDVGVATLLRGVGASAAAPSAESMEWDLLPDNEDRGEMYVTLLDDVELQGFRNAPWTNWLRANADVESGAKTLDEFEGGVLPGREPPAEILEMANIYKDLQGTVFGSVDYLFLATEYWQRWSDNVYTIGTVAETPFIFIARSNIGNIPTELPPWLEGKLDLNHFGNQWYYKPE